MSLNAVQQAIAGFLNGVQAQGYTEPLACSVDLPIASVVKVQQPVAFVWGGTGHENRLTIPRGEATAGTEGWKETLHAISVTVFSIELANDPNRTWRFPNLLDTVMATLRSITPMPQQITDPQTGAVSDLLDLGESFDWDYDIDRTINPQNTLRNMARLDVAVREEFKA